MNSEKLSPKKKGPFRFQSSAQICSILLCLLNLLNIYPSTNFCTVWKKLHQIDVICIHISFLWKCIVYVANCCSYIVSNVLFLAQVCLHFYKQIESASKKQNEHYNFLGKHIRNRKLIRYKVQVCYIWRPQNIQ